MLGQHSVHPLIRQIGAALFAGAAGTVLALVRAAVCGPDLQSHTLMRVYVLSSSKILVCRDHLNKACT